MGTRPKLVSAARILVYVNGKLYGRCTSFSWTSLTPRKKIHVCDIANAVELATTTTDVTWQMGVLRVIGDGGAQGAGIVADQINISREKYFTLTLVERQTDMTLFEADLCNVDSESWSVAAKSLMLGSIAGSGIVWTNEASDQ